MAVAVPVAAQGYMVGKALMESDTAGAVWRLTGVKRSGEFSTADFLANWGPTLAGALVHIGANKLGINRMLANAKIPLIRI